MAKRPLRDPKAPLTDLEASDDPRMVALEAQLADERAAQEAHWEHRRSALYATIREDDHRARYGHRHVAGENGKCARVLDDGSTCDVLIHPEQAEDAV